MAKKMFIDQGRGKSFLDNFCERVYHQDHESNILHSLQQNDITPREGLTGLSLGDAFVKKTVRRYKADPCSRQHPQSQKNEVHHLIMENLRLGDMGRRAYHVPRILSGIMITPLDQVLGSMYLRYEAWLVLAKTSLVTRRLPVQIQLQQLGLPQELLTEEMGAYAEAQIFLTAVKQLSEKESNPANNTLLTPIEFNKILFSMLINIYRKIPYLLEFIEVKESIIGPTGDQEMATLVTVLPSDNAEQSTTVIIVDETSVTVLTDTCVVAPNPVLSREKTFQTKHDWSAALENLKSEGPSSEQGKELKPTRVLKQISHKNDNHDRLNFKSNDISSRPFVYICRTQCEVKLAQLNNNGTEKLTKATKLLMKSPKGGKEPIDKLTCLKEIQRKSLEDHANVSFLEEREGQRRFNKALPVSNDLIESKISAETLAAYMLATYSYPADKGPVKKVRVAQEDPNPDQSSDEEQPSGGLEEPTPPRKLQRTSKKKKSKSSSPNVRLTDDGRHIFHEGRLHSLHSDGASSDNGSDNSGKSNRSKRFGGDSDDSQFDQDSGSDAIADRSHRKSKSRKKTRGRR